MKKRIVMIAICISLSLSGCVNSVEMEKEVLNYADNKVELYEVKEYEDFVKEIDFSTSHIKADIKNNLLIDADISICTGLDMGIYSYENKDEYYVYNEDERMEKVKRMARLVDEYYGRDVTVMFDEEGDVNVNECSYVNSEDEKYFVSEIWEKTFPYYESEYDKKFIDDIVDKFVNHYREVLPKDISEQYRCVYFTDDFRKKMLNEFENLNLDNIGRSYYMINMYSEIEQEICLETDEQITYESIGENSRAYGFRKEDVIIYEQVAEPRVSILIDEVGEVFAFKINDSIIVGECVEAVDILSEEEILECIYNMFAYSEHYGKIIIREIRLKYIPYLSNNLDENGYRASYLLPVWSVKYNKRNEMKHNTIIFSAETGEIILRKLYN